jgi:putative ABC transport system ATP-binding protein
VTQALALDAKPTLSPSARTPALELRKVRRTYVGPPPVEALRGVDLVVREGDFVAICGPSGSGKSTLLNLLGLLDEPTGGRLFFCGEDTTTISAARRTRLRATRIGFVFQSFELLEHRTALENVEVGLMYRGIRRRDRAGLGLGLLDQVGMTPRAHALTSQLSGGERQRVAIARALAGEPAVLLCDEPTGNVDSRNASAILDLFGELHAGGTTIVLITHDEHAASRAERIVTILDGVLGS